MASPDREPANAQPDPIPAEAVQAAAEALARRDFTDKTFEGYARAAVEAAAPFIAAQALITERRRALRLVRRTLVPRGCKPTHDAAQLIAAIKGDLRV